MPGRDGTGPMGAGPRTGRGLGPCGGVNRGAAGMGRGWGGGRRGWRHVFNATGLPRWARRGFAPLTPEEKQEALKDEAARLQTQLDEVNQRLQSIQKKA